MRTILLMTILAVAVPSRVVAQGAVQGSVQGTIRDSTQTPVDAATVILQSREDTTDVRRSGTDRFGFFRFGNVLPGEYVLRVERIGFETVTQNVRVTSGQATSVTLETRPVALPVGAVRVEAERARVRFENEAGATRSELSQQELKLIPGLAEADLLRAIEVLPGVVSTSDFSSSFNVRGGAADQNLILIDGIPIYNPFHLGGLFSVFNSDMVNRAGLLAGGFPAEFGHRVSSVLSVDSDPGPGGTDVRGAISLLAARLAAAADFPDGLANTLGLRSGRARLSLRRSYFDQIFRPAFDFPYHLTDAQLYAEAWTKDGARLSLTGYAGTDLLDFRGVDDFPLKLRWDWGNQLIGGRYERQLHEGAMSTTTFGFTRFATAMLFPDFSDTDFSSRISQAFLRSDLVLAGGARAEWKLGLDGNRLSYENRAISGGTVFRAESAADWLFGAYAQLAFRPTQDWLIEASARGDAWLAAEDPLVISPRLAVKRFLGRSVAVRVAAGRYSQFLHSVRDEELPIALDVWMLSGPRAPIVVSDQVQGGIEVIRDGWRFNLEAYYRAFDGVVTNNIAEDPNIDNDNMLEGSGTSYGADLHIRRDAGRIRGFASVSWLQARRTFPDATSGLEPPPDVEYAPVFDRRIDADIVLQTTLPANWQFGVRFNLGTGLPFTRPLGTFLYYETQLANQRRRVLNNAPDEAMTGVVLGPRNSERFPTYTRLDLGVRKTFRKGWGQLTPYMDVLNVLNRKNVLFYFYEFDESPPVRSGVSMFPVLPTIGVEVVF